MLYAAKHLAADFLTAIVFITVFAATENLPLAIGATVLAAIAQIGVALVRKQKLDPMVWLGLFLALAFGTASLVAKDPRFVMAKPSIIHGAIALAMLRRGWMLRYVDDQARQHVPEQAMISAGYAWAGWMIVLAIANLVVSQTMPFATWAWFVSVGLIAAKVVGFAATYGWFRYSAKRYGRATKAAAITP